MDARLHLHLDPFVALRSLDPALRDPQPSAVAILAELAGIDGVALSLRDARSAIQERDVHLLRESVSTRFDLALSPVADLVTRAFDLRPDRVTLVSERMEEDGLALGLDAHVLKEALKKHIGHLRDADLQVAVRVEPGLEQIKALHRLDVHAVVLVTSGYVTARTASERRIERARLQDAAVLAARLGLSVGIEGGLDLRALEQLATIAPVEEFHVGHALASRAMLIGIERAVQDFRAALDRGRRRAI